MEWFVVGIFGFFIVGLIWVSGEAIRHARKSKIPNKTNTADPRASRG